MPLYGIQYNFYGSSPSLLLAITKTRHLIPHSDDELYSQFTIYAQLADDSYKIYDK